MLHLWHSGAHDQTLPRMLCVLALGGVTALQVLPAAVQGGATRPVLKRATTLVAAAAAEEEGKAGLSTSTANLVKSIVGSGVLSLPVGVAAFSSARTAILPAIALLAVAGAISGYCAPHPPLPHPPHLAHAALHAHQHASTPARTPARCVVRLTFSTSAGFSAVGRVCAATGSKLS